MREYLENDEKAFGNVLKTYRKANKITQKRVAEYLGIDRSTYAKYETMRKPEIDVVLKLSVLYDVSLDEFMGPFFSDDKTQFAAFASPEDKEMLEVTAAEKRLITIYRNSIRKTEIMQAAEEILNTDTKVIKENAIK